ncbi:MULTISPECIES: class E sortase [Streptomyces]|uniref:class E sortase n=1 Tax=Streptomyces TaxID=1883 RepID=UPI00163C5FE4|nr:MULTISPECIES: class E sortase [Streptomyces]MBC2873674.1 class E sortase [Streptomyces sp. TYQ1024]UBI37896.1 class E sortase [Streptomyces mobaraensis]UKW30483.1 class E sortase [Streptomyces sp. TYQ1024]
MNGLRPERDPWGAPAPERYAPPPADPRPPADPYGYGQGEPADGPHGQGAGEPGPYGGPASATGPYGDASSTGPYGPGRNVPADDPYEYVPGERAAGPWSSAPAAWSPGVSRPLPPENAGRVVARPLPPETPHQAVSRPLPPEAPVGVPPQSQGSALPLPPEDDATMPLRRTAAPPAPSVTAPPAGGRAERRRAARRAERARKDGLGVVVSRLLGEVFITIGVVMLLFVAYQLWWTNVIAQQQAGGAAKDLRRSWARDGGTDRDAGAFSPGEGFAIIYIPKLDVKAPIAEGTGKHKVLDRGMVGHYGKGPLKTAMPWDRQGNFALAGHRNTHGEPFRYVNRLQPGDKIVVETKSAFYTYEMTSRLDQTSPANVGVIRPVPQGSGFTGPGRYITLTTCTPEFTSTYRMIVWGKMVDERPRAKGKPDALVD